MQCPIIPVVASSYDQADLVFGSAKAMIQMELRHFVDIQERKIIVKDNPNAYILRVPCVAGQNDGLRPAPFGIFDEIHEMTGNKEKAHLSDPEWFEEKNKHNWNQHNNSWS